MIENVIDTTEYCRHCLMCRHVAPVGHVTHRETVTPHGVAQLVASERRGMIEWTDDTVQALYAFSDNGDSRAHCVTSQPLGEAIAAARSEVVAQDKAPAVVYELHDKLQRWENPHEAAAPEPPTGAGDVALFVGDDAAHLRPSTLEAALALLQAVDIDPVLIGRGRNNGFLASSLGLPSTAEALVRATLQELAESGASTLLVLAPGDYFAFGQMSDERLGIPWPDDVELLEVTQLLAQKMEEGALGFSQDASVGSHAYVDPTHAVRVPSHYAPARQLAGAVYPEADRVELFWRNGRAHPSGNLAVQFTSPDVADQLTKARLKDAQSVGAQRVLTADPGSLHHLAHHASSFDVTVDGLFETLAARRT
jgi:Fe-S oxidoreductase